MLDVKIERLNMALQVSMVTDSVKFGATKAATSMFQVAVVDAICEKDYDQLKITVDLEAGYNWTNTPNSGTINKSDATKFEMIEDLYSYIVKLVHKYVDGSIKEESIVVEIRQLQPHGIPPSSLVTWQNGYAYYEEAFYHILVL